MLKDKLPPFLKGLVGAILGAILVLALKHLYEDHLAVHEMQTFLIQNAAKIAKLP